MRPVSFFTKELLADIFSPSSMLSFEEEKEAEELQSRYAFVKLSLAGGASWLVILASFTSAIVTLSTLNVESGMVTWGGMGTRLSFFLHE